jgi:hypothetical protein
MLCYAVFAVTNGLLSQITLSLLLKCCSLRQTARGPENVFTHELGHVVDNRSAHGSAVWSEADLVINWQ